MMNVRYRPLVVALLAVTLGAIAGCDQRAPGETVGQKLDRTADKMAANAGAAASRAATAIDDTALTTKVKAAIIADPGLKALQIQVDTKDAVVTLAGNVDTMTMHDRALQLAKSVEGVGDVVDNLVVKVA